MNPFFDSTTNLSAHLLPKEITSLPIFMGPEGIDVSRDETNAVMISTGSGFGHWGLLVTRSGWAPNSEWTRERIISWGDGVYFYSEFRWAKSK